MHTQRKRDAVVPMTPQQKAAELVSLHGVDRAHRICRENSDRFKTGSDNWVFWMRVNVQVGEIHKASR